MKKEKLKESKEKLFNIFICTALILILILSTFLSIVIWYYPHENTKQIVWSILVNLATANLWGICIWHCISKYKTYKKLKKEATDE